MEREVKMEVTVRFRDTFWSAAELGDEVLAHLNSLVGVAGVKVGVGRVKEESDAKG